MVEPAAPVQGELTPLRWEQLSHSGSMVIWAGIKYLLFYLMLPSYSFSWPPCQASAGQYRHSAIRVTFEPEVHHEEGLAHPGRDTGDGEQLHQPGAGGVHQQQVQFGLDKANLTNILGYRKDRGNVSYSGGVSYPGSL